MSRKYVLGSIDKAKNLNSVGDAIDPGSTIQVYVQSSCLGYKLWKLYLLWQIVFLAAVNSYRMSIRVA